MSATTAFVDGPLAGETRAGESRIDAVLFEVRADDLDVPLTRSDIAPLDVKDRPRFVAHRYVVKQKVGTFYLASFERTVSVEEAERAVETERAAFVLRRRCPCIVGAVNLGYNPDDLPGELRGVGQVCGAPAVAVERGQLVRIRPGMEPPRTEPSPAGARYQCSEGHWFAVVDGEAVPAGPPEDITVKEEWRP